jgi:CheY-like chemotaxis protein
MTTVLIAGMSPVRTRLADMISELRDMHLDVEGPDVDASRIISHIHPDVVLVDIDQTNGHGLDIIRQFHERRNRRVPVIIAIASSRSLHYRASCLAAGALYFFNCMREQDWLLDSLRSIREQIE